MPARPRLQRILLACLLACVVLPVALFFLIRQNALENARKNPWSRIAPGTKLIFEETSRGKETSRSAWSVTLVERKPLVVSLQTTHLAGDGQREGLVHEVDTFSLAEPESRFDDVAPVESMLVAPSGVIYRNVRRVETLSPDAHDTYWIDPELPLYVKHTHTTRDGEVTTWLREIRGPERERR